MPLTTPDFTAEEGLYILDRITFTDTSTGSDGGLTERRIYVRLANGNWLTTAGESTTEVYEIWAISDTSTTLSLLTKSTTATVTIKWMTDSAATYTKSRLTEWDLYEYVFGYGQLSNQTAKPGIIQDANYQSNFFSFITNIWNSENAVLVGDDLYSSQGALDVNQNMITNESLYF